MKKSTKIVFSFFFAIRIDYLQQENKNIPNKQLNTIIDYNNVIK